MQKIITLKDTNYSSLDAWFSQVESVMLVCGKSIEKQAINQYLKNIGKITRFSDFKPNPAYESVAEGVKLFRKNHCDSIIAVGGGSAIDVAKSVKLFSNMESSGENGAFLKQKIEPNNIPFLAVPTTAGTGSEATKYAVIYYNGIKQSITHESCIPETVLFDSSLLKTLPYYQRKATMCDALSHALESFWSVNSTGESKEYSKQALKNILKYMEGYLRNTDDGNSGMLFAANTAGKAINITQTTAGHAMCYKITSFFNISHGHAAILCNRVLYRHMLKNIDKCIDKRGKNYLKATLHEIENILSVKELESILSNLQLEIPAATPQQFAELKSSVNLLRLKNHPIELTNEDINELYHEILREN